MLGKLYFKTATFKREGSKPSEIKAITKITQKLFDKLKKKNNFESDSLFELFFTHGFKETSIRSEIKAKDVFNLQVFGSGKEVKLKADIQINPVVKFYLDNVSEKPTEKSQLCAVAEFTIKSDSSAFRKFFHEETDHMWFFEIIKPQQEALGEKGENLRPKTDKNIGPQQTIPDGAVDGGGNTGKGNVANVNSAADPFA